MTGMWAQVHNGIVQNIVAADEDWIATQEGEWVAFTDDNYASPGLGYDAETGKFEQPPTPDAPVV